MSQTPGAAGTYSVVLGVSLKIVRHKLLTVDQKWMLPSHSVRDMMQDCDLEDGNSPNFSDIKWPPSWIGKPH